MSSCVFRVYRNYFRKEGKEKASTIAFLKKVTNEINYKV